MENDNLASKSFSKENLENFLEFATNTKYLPDIRIYYGMVLLYHYKSLSDDKNLKELLYNPKIHPTVRLILADFLFSTYKESSNFEEIIGLLADDKIPYYCKERIFSFVRNPADLFGLEFSKNVLDNLTKILEDKSNQIELKNLAVDLIISSLKNSKDENFLLNLGQKNIPKSLLEKIKSSFRIYNPLSKKTFELNLPKPSNLSQSKSSMVKNPKNKLSL